MVFLYVIIALMGVMVVETGLYYDLMSSYNFENAPVLPYILCFVCNIMLLEPLRYIQDIDDNDYGIFYNKRINSLVLIWSLAYVFFTVLKVNETIQTMSVGLAESYQMRHSEGVALFQYSGPLRLIYTLLTAAQPITVPFIMFYSFIGLRDKYITSSKAYFLIVLCFLPALLSALAKGSRGSLFMEVFCFIFFVLTFWNHVNTNIKSSVKRIMICVVGFGLAYSWLISLDRAENTEVSAMDGIIRYFGEPFPNLVALYWDKINFHPMGTLMFGDFLPDVLPAYWDPSERTKFWSDLIGAPTYNWKTFFGSLYLEFGSVIACAFTFGLSYIFKSVFKKLSVNLITLPLVYFYFQMCVFSFAGFTKNDETSLHQIIGVLLLMWILPKFLKG